MALAQQSPNQPYSSNPRSLKSLQPKFADELLARTDTLISRIRPTGQSLERRWIITAHVTALVQRCFSAHDVSPLRRAEHVGDAGGSTHGPGLEPNTARCLVRPCLPARELQVTAIPFGSVPLKTYLPDGDIDLSIYSESPRAQTLKEALRETWATQLQMCLEEEANNPNAMFRVANVQVIHAEVSRRGLTGLEAGDDPCEQGPSC